MPALPEALHDGRAQPPQLRARDVRLPHRRHHARGGQFHARPGSAGRPRDRDARGAAVSRVRETAAGPVGPGGSRAGAVCAGGEEAKGGEGGGWIETLGLQIGAPGDLRCGWVPWWKAGFALRNVMNGLTKFWCFSKELLGLGLGS